MYRPRPLSPYITDWEKRVSTRLRVRVGIQVTLMQNLAQRGAHIIAFSPKPVQDPEVEILINLLRQERPDIRRRMRSDILPHSKGD
ncbi:hypothetical protein EV702DRAFT_1104748 [Suillus placidus]|uniref:Uncharacterized protein n=1 Tax=Suillus placidus TaxID=48579 RepID=A0A9P6ZUP5_9AGAM|nr:hypothetical protein EV702DRAFT_1104748 [Suillus placidus]